MIRVEFVFFIYKIDDAHANTTAKHRCLASVLTLHIIDIRTDFFSIHLSVMIGEIIIKLMG